MKDKFFPANFFLLISCIQLFIDFYKEFKNGITLRDTLIKPSYLKGPDVLL
jgi:hypothetical protein